LALCVIRMVVVKDPDMAVQERLELVFEMFLKFRTVAKVMRLLNDRLDLPRATGTVIVFGASEDLFGGGDPEKSRLRRRRCRWPDAYARTRTAKAPRPRTRLLFNPCHSLSLKSGWAKSCMARSSISPAACHASGQTRALLMLNAKRCCLVEKSARSRRDDVALVRIVWRGGQVIDLEFK
jgi:hypothetical protein